MLKEECKKYIEWCKQNNLKPCYYSSLKAYFETKNN